MGQTAKPEDGSKQCCWENTSSEGFFSKMINTTVSSEWKEQDDHENLQSTI